MKERTGKPTEDIFDLGIDIDDSERSDIELWLVKYFEPPFFKLRFLLIVPVLCR